MTQPFTSDDQLPTDQSVAGKGAEDHAERTAKLANSEQPAIVHPNFDPNQTPLDPARSLSDIPEPARRVNSQLRQLYGQSARFHQPKAHALSKWQLMASAPFSEHLGLLSAAKLIALPDSFYHNNSEQPLLSSLENMSLLDMADIQRAISHYPRLQRYGFSAIDSPAQTTADDKSVNNINADDMNSDDMNSDDIKALPLRTLAQRYDPDELLSSLYADDWQVVLQPQQFETGMGSLATDIMACSVAVHALKQCDTRKSINHSYSAAQICQHVRSYLLNQLCLAPAHRYHYRQIPLFTGHIIVAAYHLGWDTQVRADGQCYFNLSSRSGLLTRYANMLDYDINGWSS